LDVNRKALKISFLVVGSVALQQFVNFTVAGESLVASSLWIVAVLLCISAEVFLARRCLMQASREMGVILGFFLLLAIISGILTIFCEIPNIRQRAQVSNSAVWKPVPAIFGFPALPAALFMLLMFAAEVGTLEACRHVFGDDSGWRQTLSAVSFSLGWLAVAIMNGGRLRDIFEAQQALAAEKAMMESIITMMCDAIVWLSENGSTVVRADQRFHQILGRDATGERAEDFFQAEERERFRSHLAESKATPALLPTSLVTQAGYRIPVEMFVVGNRDISSIEGKACKTPGFLIGIRLASNEGVETFPDTHMKSPRDLLAPGLFDRRPEPDELQSGIAPSSVPETTTTDRAFDCLDIDHWLEGAPEEQEEELRQRLKGVISIGQAERWLMSLNEVDVAPDQILGAGSFGVVVCGWLHGSPVALKTTRSTNDGASPKQLLAIANEIRILRHIRHPNVVLFHGACVDPKQGEIMMVLERVQGPDLYSYVARHSSDFEVYSRLQLLLDVACALRYLHAQAPKVVHGDLKGSNILVENAMPRAKLVDFGLSRLLTKSVRPMGGTMEWMAPELVLDRARKPQPSADVFSCGRVAHMIIACRKPLQGIRRRTILNMAKNGTIPILIWREGSPLHSECKQMCEQLLKFDPEQRPSMVTVHQEASAWMLPHMKERMPALELSRATDSEREGLRRRAAPPLRETLASALVQHGTAAQQLAEGGNRPAKTGHGASSSGPARAAGSAEAVPRQEELGAAPGPGPDAAKKAVLMTDVASQWNFPVSSGGCCRFHAVAADLLQAARELARRECDPSFQPSFKCKSMGQQSSLSTIQEEDAPASGARTLCSL